MESCYSVGITNRFAQLLVESDEESDNDVKQEIQPQPVVAVPATAAKIKVAVAEETQKKKKQFQKLSTRFADIGKSINNGSARPVKDVTYGVNKGPAGPMKDATQAGMDPTRSTYAPRPFKYEYRNTRGPRFGPYGTTHENAHVNRNVKAPAANEPEADDKDRKISENETIDQGQGDEEVKDKGDGEVGEEKEGNAETNNTEEEFEEPPKMMTLDEYRALQTPREKPVYNIRKPGEGEDQSKWKGLTLKKRDDTDEEHEQEETDDEEEEEHRHGGRQKVFLNIEFQYSDSRRWRGRGRGRGGFRDGRGDYGPPPRDDGYSGRGRGGRSNDEGTSRGFGRGGGRGFGYRGRSNQQYCQRRPRVHDERDFPSLTS